MNGDHFGAYGDPPTIYRCKCCGQVCDAEYYEMHKDHYGCPDCKNSIKTYYEPTKRNGL